MIEAARHSLPSPTPLLRSLTPSSRLSPRIQCLQKRASPAQRRSFLRERQSHRAVENFNLNRMRKESYNYYVRRRNFLICGLVASSMVSCYIAYLIYLELKKPKKLDSGKPDPFTTEAGSRRKVVIHDAEGREFVPTGNSVVPTFPRTITLPSASETKQINVNDVGYTLVGLGVRTVTFIGIQVYVVGYYIATQDIAAIQSRLVKEINPIATTLVASEKEALRQALLDPERGEKLWNAVLQEIRPRSIFRIVPVRDTDFHHMRDGFVRAITTRSQTNHAEFGDEAFGAVMKEFKALFNRGKVPKGREMLLCRDAAGSLTVAYDDGKSGTATLGRVADERVSRLLWLNYLAGKQVASEPARKNIVEGIMEFVERPIGTVAAQVL